MADFLDWVQQMLGGQGNAAPIQTDDALGDLQRSLTVSGQPGAAWQRDPLGYAKRYLATSGEALSEAPAGIARGVGDVGQMLWGLAQRQGMLEAGLPLPPEGELAPLGPGARTLGGAFDFLTGGMTHGAIPQGSGYAARQAIAIPSLLADESGALRVGGRPPRGAITLDTRLPAVPDLPPEELIAGVGNNRPPQPRPAPFPQYAESYPEVGPAVMKFDPKKGTEYLGKQLTPEAMAFKKERDRVIKDMRVVGYTPYYDPEQRFHVDPTNYPPTVDTTAIEPAKQATIDKYMASIGSDEARARLQTAYQRGTEMPNTANWYALGQLEQDFIKELGPVEGRKAFQDRIATSMAATTGGADPTSNWLMATYGNYLRANGLPYPQASYELPFPIGGRYGMTNVEQHQNIFDQGGFSALGAGNPKRHNFAQNFTGNPNAATMDEQMVSTMTPGLTVPPDNTYGLYERVLHEEAAKLNPPVAPQNFQDVAWSGAKNLKTPTYTSGQPFIQTVNESIERTHRLTGMPRDEIVRGIIRGNIPLYGLLGASGLGAAADDR